MTQAHPWNASIIAPRIKLVGWSDRAQLWIDSTPRRQFASSLDALAWMQNAWNDLSLPPDEPWRGFLSYELGRLFEQIPDRRATRTDAPIFCFGLQGREKPEHSSWSRVTLSQTRQRQVTRDQYLGAVQRVIDYIAAGDVFQVNLSQQFVFDLQGRDTREIYRSMQEQSPARYAAFQNFGDIDLLCNSPELFFQIIPHADGSRTILNRPIKGTRPRGPGMFEALRDSAKDKAELAMIVDLQRNDLGRVCEIGSVRVVSPRQIEELPTLYHGVASVEGTLRPDVGFVDVLRAIFPCGSITGCPKIRAMQIIDELEPSPRGAYCGAIGQVHADGAMTFNVAIRTMIREGQSIIVPVGGGIVADSDPADEYEETLVKARAMFAALGVDAKNR